MVNNFLVGEGPLRITRQRVSWQSSQRSGAELSYTLRIYQNTKKLAMSQSSRRGQTKMAIRMDSKQQGCCNKTIFSNLAEEARDKISTYHEASSLSDRTRYNKDISLSVQIKVRREMYMRPQRTNHGSSSIPFWEYQHTARGTKYQVNQRY